MDIRLKNEAVAIAQLLYGSAVCVLIVLGMSGAIYKVIGPQGLIERAFGAALTGEFKLLLAVTGACALAWTARTYFSRRLVGRLWSATTYLFGMLGALFAVRLATLGTL
jgi:hypothetical protein